MKDFKWDRPKSLAQIRKELDKGCVICNKPLTNMQGVGSNLLCRDHQLEEISYGGYGKLSKPHTFYRSDVCACCGQDINNDPRWKLAQQFFNVSLSDSQTNEVKRRYNHGDHNFREADGGDDSQENINAFCTFCHWVKTVINNDSRKSDRTDIEG